MARDFDAEIAQQQTQLERLLDEMDLRREAFVVAATEQVAAWWWERAQKEVQTYPQVTEKLGADGMMRFKAAVKELQAQASRIAEEELAERDLWWHLRDAGQVYLMGHERSPRPAGLLANRIQYIVGRLGLILEEFGFAQKPSPERGMPPTWREAGHNVTDPKPYFRGDVPWSYQMFQPMFEYSHLRDQGAALKKAIERLKTEKAQAQAQALWDKA